MILNDIIGEDKTEQFRTITRGLDKDMKFEFEND